MATNNAVNSSLAPPYAMSGVNTNITSMTGLTGALRAPTMVLDTNGNEVLVFSNVASAVNYIDVRNSATGVNPGFFALGDDSDIGMTFNAKGTGTYQFAASATSPTILNWFEQTTNGSNSINVHAPASIASSQTVTWKSASSGFPVLDSVTGDGWTSFSAGVGYTGFSANPPTTRALYKRFGNTVLIYIDTGNGTSNATGFTITGLPFTAAVQVWTPMNYCTDNSGNTVGVASISGTTATMYIGTGIAVAGWTAANLKAARIMATYECS